MSYSSDNTYEKILERALSNKILADFDKREGSVIYDALAPLCMELADAYVKMDILEDQTYLLSATGTNLDKRAYDYGVKREEAIKARRVAEFKKYKTDARSAYALNVDGERILIDAVVPVGTRFITPGENSITYVYIGLENNLKIVECEQPGKIGNTHLGTLLPLDPIADLVSASIVGTYVSGEDEETDDELRQRCIEIANDVSFGGNISDYINHVNQIDGVGNLKVFPAWSGNGSVLLSVVDPNSNPISQYEIDRIKNLIDPDEDESGNVTSGMGIGIAPIGHYVTVTTPIRDELTITLDIETKAGVAVSQVEEEIIEHIKKYFESVRKEFAQDSQLGIYRVRIIDAVLDVPEVLNITTLLLNDVDQDIIYVDSATIDGQKLPYVKEVVIE